MVRRFLQTDLEEMMEIWLKGNLQAHSFVEKEYWKVHSEAVRQGILQAEVLVFEENEILGFLGLAGGGYIAGLFVKEGCRGRGIGKALLEWAKKRQESLTLQVYERNAGALRFYIREGFSVVGTQRDENGEKEFVMEWKKKR